MRNVAAAASRVHRLFASHTLGYKAQPFLTRRFLLPHSRFTSSVAQAKRYGAAPTLIASGIGLVASAALLYRTADAESSTPFTTAKLATITYPEQLEQNSTAIPSTRASKRDIGQTLEPLDSNGLNKVLSQHAESHVVDRGRGVIRFDLTQVPSNDPLEDDHSEAILEAPGNAGDWMFWGVYDGHSGWATSAKLRHSLIGYVYAELKSRFSGVSSSPKAEEIDSAIKTAFIRLDDEITYASVERAHKAKSKMLAPLELSPAVAGSCALLSFFDTETNLLRVACVGDSRAVLGRRSSDGMWTASALSVDQTGGNPDEEARIRAAHPGEEHAISNGRVTGRLEPTRAFGDSVYKWSRDVSTKLIESGFFVRSLWDRLQTPPYVTAEPVITTTKINPARDDFVIMASDSLWECLTNEEAVGLVGKWIDKQKAERSGKQEGLYNRLRSAVFPPDPKLPVELDGAASSGKTVFRPKQWNLTRGHERFVFTDANAATHLARNSLGGDETDLMAGLLGTPSPHSRRFRDDLTITVIFFGDEKEAISPSGVGNSGQPKNRTSKL